MDFVLQMLIKAIWLLVVWGIWKWSFIRLIERQHTWPTSIAEFRYENRYDVLLTCSDFYKCTDEWTNMWAFCCFKFLFFFCVQSYKISACWHLFGMQQICLLVAYSIKFTSTHFSGMTSFKVLLLFAFKRFIYYCLLEFSLIWLCHILAAKHPLRFQSISYCFLRNRFLLHFILFV